MIQEFNFDVTVVMAVRNEAIHIESALRSLLDQQGLRSEVIVVDDNSEDGTPTILEKLQPHHENLRVLRNPGKGKCAAFNFGMSLARGRFACLFAGDDIMPPGSLAERFERVRTLDDGTPVIGLCKLLTMSDVPRFDGHIIPKKPGRSALSGVSPLMNKMAREGIFPVPEQLPNEDTWMELAVLHMPNWVILHSDIVGCHWRVHDGNSINMMLSFPEYNKRITSRMRAMSLFLERHGPELADPERKALQGKADCEAARARGSVWGVLRTPIPWVDRLRALSITNAFWYGIRHRLYGLLSGW